MSYFGVGLSTPTDDFASGDPKSAHYNPRQSPCRSSVKVPARRNRVLSSSSVVAAKTRLCQRFVRGVCSSPNCTFAHGDSELRRKPDLRKTKLCDAFTSNRSCPKGADCTYAHGHHELQSTSEYFKTSLCPNWKQGHCQAGDSCRHAHGTQELRSRVGGTASSSLSGGDSGAASSFYDARGLGMDLVGGITREERQQYRLLSGALPSGGHQQTHSGHATHPSGHSHAGSHASGHAGGHASGHGGSHAAGHAAGHAGGHALGHAGGHTSGHNSGHGGGHSAGHVGGYGGGHEASGGHDGPGNSGSLGHSGQAFGRGVDGVPLYEEQVSPMIAPGFLPGEQYSPRMGYQSAPPPYAEYTDSHFHRSESTYQQRPRSYHRGGFASSASGDLRSTGSMRQAADRWGGGAPPNKAAQWNRGQWRGNRWNDDFRQGKGHYPSGRGGSGRGSLLKRGPMHSNSVPPEHHAYNDYEYAARNAADHDRPQSMLEAHELPSAATLISMATEDFVYSTHGAQSMGSGPHASTNTRPHGPTAMGTPAMGNSAMGNSAMGNSAMGNSAMSSSAMGQTVMGTPAMSTPALGTPAMSTPSMSTTAMGTPAIGNTAMGTPAMGNTAMGTPAMGTPALGTPAMGTPAMGTPAMGTPALGTPAMGTSAVGGVPLSTAAMSTSAAAYGAVLQGVSGYQAAMLSQPAIFSSPGYSPKLGLREPASQPLTPVRELKSTEEAQLTHEDDLLTDEDHISSADEAETAFNMMRTDYSHSQQTAYSHEHSPSRPPAAHSSMNYSALSLDTEQRSSSLLADHRNEPACHSTEFDDRTTLSSSGQALDVTHSEILDTADSEKAQGKAQGEAKATPHAEAGEALLLTKLGGEGKAEIVGGNNSGERLDTAQFNQSGRLFAVEASASDAAAKELAVTAAKTSVPSESSPEAASDGEAVSKSSGAGDVSGQPEQSTEGALPASEVADPDRQSIPDLRKFAETKKDKNVRSGGRSSSVHVCAGAFAALGGLRRGSVNLDTGSSSYYLSRWNSRASSAFYTSSPTSRRQSKQSVLCIDLSDSKPAAADAYPLAALVGRHMGNSPGGHPNRRRQQADYRAVDCSDNDQRFDSPSTLEQHSHSNEDHRGESHRGSDLHRPAEQHRVSPDSRQPEPCHPVEGGYPYEGRRAASPRPSSCEQRSGDRLDPWTPDSRSNFHHYHHDQQHYRQYHEHKRSHDHSSKRHSDWRGSSGLRTPQRAETLAVTPSTMSPAGSSPAAQAASALSSAALCPASLAGHGMTQWPEGLPGLAQGVPLSVSSPGLAVPGMPISVESSTGSLPPTETDTMASGGGFGSYVIHRLSETGEEQLEAAPQMRASAWVPSGSQSPYPVLPYGMEDFGGANTRPIIALSPSGPLMLDPMTLRALMQNGAATFGTESYYALQAAVAGKEDKGADCPNVGYTT